MSKFAVVWDLETVPDLEAFKRMNGTPDIADEEAEALHGDKFAKLPLHKIACIGAYSPSKTATFSGLPFKRCLTVFLFADRHA